ncbi:MAG: TetR/AcrR family transcriptional regulator [Nonomuraea sp.]|nr:TetR/AcrR family transcriptional regulator [Nonomuraea sp.]
METVRRMRRAERREQILGAATRAFAARGYAATSLDDVAAEAGISRVILYRHFESKSELYRAILERAGARLVEQVGEDDFSSESIPSLVRAAGADPDGFRLLFRYAAREPEFRAFMDGFTSASIEIARTNLATRMPDLAWLDWAARMAFTVSTEGVLAWLDAGQPDPELAGARISAAVRGVLEAASHSFE